MRHKIKITFTIVLTLSCLILPIVAWQSSLIDSWAPNLFGGNTSIDAYQETDSNLLKDYLPITNNLVNPHPPFASETPSTWSTYIDPEGEFIIAIPPDWSPPEYSKNTYSNNAFFNDKKFLLTIGFEPDPQKDDFKSYEQIINNYQTEGKEENIINRNDNLKKYLIETDGNSKTKTVIQTPNTDKLSWFTYNNEIYDQNLYFDHLINSFSLLPSKNEQWHIFHAADKSFSLNYPPQNQITELNDNTLLIHQDNLEGSLLPQGIFLQIKKQSFTKNSLKEELESIKNDRLANNKNLKISSIQKIYIGSDLLYGFHITGKALNTSYIIKSLGEDYILIKNSTNSLNDNKMALLTAQIIASIKNP